MFCQLTSLFRSSRGSLPPTIGIAMYQAPLISGYFTTLGYLIPIISVLGLAILPRGKYIQNLILNLLSAGIGAGVAMLALWSSVQARIHTTPPGERSATYTYNSSQSAVLAVWLFANIWAVNSLRARRPSFNLPTIIYSIFVNISTTFGPFMTTTAAVEAFVRELLVAVLVGLALATAVNFLVFPVSSRTVLFKQLAGCIGLMRAAIGAEKQYLRGLEGQDMFMAATRDAAAEEEARKSGKKEAKPLTKEAKSAKAVRDTTAALRELAGKMQGDLVFAKRDAAWGKLCAKDIKQMVDLFRDIYIPM
jgi:predicted membrane channel-forming protein YqfA (hemolysin III family)